MEAISRLCKLAMTGDADAMYEIGIACRKGKLGFPTSAALAAEWYTLASEQKHARAQHNLAWLLLSGTGVKRDKRRAVELMLSAAQNGNPMAQYTLGDFYQKGIPGALSKDYKRSYAWYLIAERAGYIDRSSGPGGRHSSAHFLDSSDIADAESQIEYLLLPDQTDNNASLDEIVKSARALVIKTAMIARETG